MSRRREPTSLSRVPLLALALLMFLGGGALVVHASMGDDDTQKASAPSSPSASSTASAKASATPSQAAALAQQVEGQQAALKKLKQKAQATSNKIRTARPVSSFTFANFNIQGASHRGNIGLRTSLARDLLNKYGVQVAALQEFASSQQAAFRRVTGNAWGCYPCGSGPKRLDGENSVVWRKDRFEALNLDTRPYPYFHGGIRNMPRVLLRDKKTGATFYVTSYHNPANVHGPAGKWRSIAVSRQVADANAIRRETKAPLIVAGDMNDRATYFCKMAGGTGMHSADGSSHAGGCRVARSPWIDWIMGTSDVQFSGYLRDDGRTADRASDHPIVITQVTLTGRPGEGRHAGQPVADDTAQ